MSVDIINVLITGVFTGMGAGIGNYLATKYAIDHLKDIENKIKIGGKDG
jgi:hypothetical protein